MPGGPGRQEHRTGPRRGAAAWEAARAGAGGWRKVPDGGGAGAGAGAGCGLRWWKRERAAVVEARAGGQWLAEW
ncbi:hypothetical protein AB0L02_17785 [Streptomyces anulatus]|uniref:hypothetical protein n=1 Tax=Streptomyces anulatus TaxID=1892 RepID=UPI003426E3FD